MTKVARITHRHIAKAVEALNARRGLSFGDKGHLRYADISGWGNGYHPSFYAASTDGVSSGVVNVASLYRGDTLRETLAKVEAAD